MSVEFYDLGLRLRAARERRALPRAHYAPAATPLRPIAVEITGRGEGAALHAATEHASIHRAGPLTPDGVLASLAWLGVGLGAEPHSLVIARPATLRRLARLAHSTSDRDRWAEQAALIGWWEQRAQHPGTAAVLVLTEACARRWVLGVHPDHERLLSPWLRWLSITGTGTTALLRLAEEVTAGEPLPGLGHFADSDEWSWTALCRRVASGRSWQARDSAAEAALGLVARCDAADLYASLRLADPLVATREVHTGNIVTGEVTALTRQGQLTFTAQQAMCRLRPGTDVQGWAGEAWDAPLLGDTTAVRMRGGHLSAARVDSSRTLTLSIARARFSTTPRIGDRVSLRARAVNPAQQVQGRLNLGSLYRQPDNWLRARPRRPWATPVPLDVAIAAAD